MVARPFVALKVSRGLKIASLSLGRKEGSKNLIHVLKPGDEPEKVKKGKLYCFSQKFVLILCQKSHLATMGEIGLVRTRKRVSRLCICNSHHHDSIHDLQMTF